MVKRWKRDLAVTPANDVLALLWKKRKSIESNFIRAHVVLNDIDVVQHVLFLFVKIHVLCRRAPDEACNVIFTVPCVVIDEHVQDAFVGSVCLQYCRNVQLGAYMSS